jgi:hypothetical protein
MTNQDWQRASKAHTAHSEQKPEWMQFAVKAINKWGTGDFTLQHVVAIALEDAYRMGQEGTPPPEWVPPVRPEHGGLYDFATHLKKKSMPIPEPVHKLKRRTRPGAEPEGEPEFDLYADAPDEAPHTVLRRTRPAPPPPPEISPRQAALQAALRAALAQRSPPPPPKIIRRTR